MKIILTVLFCLCVLVGCGESKEEKAAKADAEAEAKAAVEAAAQPKPTKGVPMTIDAPIVEKAIRKELTEFARISRSYNKPTGELTTADLEKVRDLTLADNQLTRIPKELEKLTKLKRLDLSYNQLTNVKGLENLTQLTSLGLRYNKLTSVNVEDLEKLTQLTELELGFNKMTEVKGLEKLDQLKRLYLSFNPALTKSQIDELKKALPKCDILSNPKK